MNKERNLHNLSNISDQTKTFINSVDEFDDSILSDD